MKIYNFTYFGDAGNRLKELYAQGWRLRTVVSNMAVSMPIQEACQFINNDYHGFGHLPTMDIYKEMEDNSRIFMYAVEYFLEKE